MKREDFEALVDALMTEDDHLDDGRAQRELDVQRILTALEARGLAVVPVVATEGMKQAAADAWHNAKDDPALCPLGPGESSAFFYAAMLSASKDDPNV